MRDLIARSGTQTIGWDRRQLRSDEGSVRIDQVVMIVKITPVNAVLLVKAIIQTNVVLPVVEGIGLLKGGVVRRSCVRVSHRELLHGTVNRGESFPVSRQQTGWNHVSSETAGPDRCGFDAAIRIEGRGNASTGCVRRISEDSVIGRAHDTVWSAQA